MYYEYYTEEFSYSHALGNICIFCWSHTQNCALSTPALSSLALLSSASLAFLTFNILALLPRVTVVESSLTDHLLYFWSVWLFRFCALWFGQEVHVIRCQAECTGRRRGKSALAPCPAFMCGWIITYILTKSCQLPVWPWSSFDGCQAN